MLEQQECHAWEGAKSAKRVGSDTSNANGICSAMQKFSNHGIFKLLATSRNQVMKWKAWHLGSETSLVQQEMVNCNNTMLIHSALKEGSLESHAFWRRERSMMWILEAEEIGFSCKLLVHELWKEAAQ